MVHYILQPFHILIHVKALILPGRLQILIISCSNFLISDLIDKEDTLYVLKSIEQELCAPAQERVNYLPHYDTIVKGGMYEYYASEGQNPLRK